MSIFIYQKIYPCLRLPERHRRAVWRHLPHRAAAAGPADSENQAQRGRGGGPLCRSGEAAGGE